MPESATPPSLGGAALAGTLVAGYGVGSLAGSALLMAWPLRGDADRLTAVLAAVVAVTLALVITAAGIANSLFFAVTLAARSEYSPAQARGQVSGSERHRRPDMGPRGRRRRDDRRVGGGRRHGEARRRVSRSRPTR